MVGLGRAQARVETPTVGSRPIVGSKTTPREKTNNSLKATPEEENTQNYPRCLVEREQGSALRTK